MGYTVSFMALSSSIASRVPEADPFGECTRLRHSLYKPLLGGHFLFESDSSALLDLVEATYGGLPRHELPVVASEFHIELRLVPREGAGFTGEAPPRVQTRAGTGVVCGTVDACNYVVVMPAQHRALVVASEDMLAHPYHLRYELMEFAVFLLATRGMGLVPLHGACVGRDGRGVLLLGASGSGKSTLALHSLSAGLEFVAEDAILVQPSSFLATGVPNYVHMRAEALRFIDDPVTHEWIASAPVIHRRSGVAKFEADLRVGKAPLAPQPLRLVGAVFASPEYADDPGALLTPLPVENLAALLADDQPYASTQHGWTDFCTGLIERGVYALRRGRHPRDSVDALRQLLA